MKLDNKGNLLAKIKRYKTYVKCRIYLSLRTKNEKYMKSIKRAITKKVKANK